MRTRSLVGAIALTTFAFSWAATQALAQIEPHENHYKVYRSSPITMVRDVKLTDQFGSLQVTDMIFDKFATPALKIHNGQAHPLLDPLRHQDWWRFFSPQPSRTVMVKDQFGQGLWTVGNAAYLLVPSLKNVAPGDSTFLAPSNHYVCYEALAGPLLGTLVILVDQFGTVTVQVLSAKYLCNPAQKEVDGAIYPVEDPLVHMACYLVQNPQVQPRPITARDQFGFWQTQIFENDCLCVPALKDHPLKTEKTTWGKIKSLYR